MATNYKDHVHTYERTLKNKLKYRCIHPDCTHTANRDDIRGKRAKCRCGETFVLPETITRNGPFRYKGLKCNKCLTGVKETVGDLLMQQVLSEQATIETILKLPEEDAQLPLKLPSDEMELELVPGDEIGAGPVLFDGFEEDD